jgi:hypothetical protein
MATVLEGLAITRTSLRVNDRPAGEFGQLSFYSVINRALNRFGSHIDSFFGGISSPVAVTLFTP